jgi:prepilin peptidase CpaA
LQTVIFFLAVGVFAIIAYGDVRCRRIPNGLAVAIAVLGLLRLGLAGNHSAALYSILAAVLVFAVALAMFWCGWLGGGDAKLLPGSAMLVGAHDLPSFLLLMSICGAILAIAVLAANKLRRPLGLAIAAPVPSEAPSRPTVPYGVAIAVAAVVVLVMHNSFTK